MGAMLFLRLSEEHRAHGALLHELLQRHSTGLDAQHRALFVPVARKPCQISGRYSSITRVFSPPSMSHRWLSKGRHRGPGPAVPRRDQ